MHNMERMSGWRQLRWAFVLPHFRVLPAVLTKMLPSL